MEKICQCKICGSEKLKKLDKYQKAYLFRCRRCHFVFAGMNPGEEDFERVYSHYGSYDYLSDITIKRYINILKTFEEARKNGNILDIGCGKGQFLMQAKKLGWNPYGIEYGEENIRNLESLGIEIKTDIVKYPDNCFDVITAFEVLEHLVDPQNMLDEIRRILRPGGMLYITVPNFGSLSKNLLKSKWNIIAYPEHLNYFTRKTMHWFLANEGFKKIAAKTTGFSMTRVHYSKKSISQPGLKPEHKDEILRTKAETKLIYKILKNSINFILNLTGKGDSLKSFYRISK